MSRRTLNLTNPLYRYILDVSLREHPQLAALRAETAKMSGARMQIAPEQGQFMAMLIRLIGAKQTLEVGTFTGYSALAVALALADDGKVTALELDPEPITVAQRHWDAAGVTGKIDLRLGDATASLDTLIAEGAAGAYDFAFIDADKAGYEGYFERTLTLLRQGGLICVDNVLWSGRVAKPDHHDPATDALRAFNTARQADERVDISLVPIGDGLLLAQKR